MDADRVRKLARATHAQSRYLDKQSEKLRRLAAELVRAVEESDVPTQEEYRATEDEAPVREVV